MLLDLIADTFGDRVALTAGDECITYAELRALARAVSRDLSASGSATLTYADTTSLAVPVALFGAAWCGCSYAPLNFRLPADSLRAQVFRLDNPTLVGSGDITSSIGLTPSMPTGDWLNTLATSSAGENEDGYALDPERAAVILFTSGSSGAPKAALLSHDNLTSYVMETVEFACADSGERLLLAAPPFHIAGVAAVLSSIYSGRRLLTLPSFTPGGWLELAQYGQATHAFVVPTMLARIVRYMDDDPTARVPSLRSISYGGARMAAPVLERALELFPGVDFVNAYGLTETSSTIAVLGPNDHRAAFTSEDPDVRRRLESVGRPVPGVEVSIVDDSGTRVEPGSKGQIRVRGPQVSGQYLDSASSLDESGWLITGDSGFIDAAGYLFVEGRVDDVIIKGGENLSPTEIEDTLLRHELVESVVVVGIPHPEWGESVAAAVVATTSYDHVADSQLREELVEWVQSRLGTLKAPSSIVFYKELPTTASGKLLRRVVRAELAEAGS